MSFTIFDDFSSSNQSNCRGLGEFAFNKFNTSTRLDFGFECLEGGLGKHITMGAAGTDNKNIRGDDVLQCNREGLTERSASPLAGGMRLGDCSHRRTTGTIGTVDTSTNNNSVVASLEKYSYPHCLSSVTTIASAADQSASEPGHSRGSNHRRKSSLKAKKKPALSSSASTDGPTDDSKQNDSELKAIGTGILEGAKETGEVFKDLNSKYQIADRAKYVGLKVKDLAMEIDEEYHIREKTKQAAISGCKLAKEINEKYHITEKAKQAVMGTDGKYHIAEKAKEAAVNGCKKAKEMNEKYQITEKTKEATINGYKKAKELNEKYHVGKKIVKGVKVAGEAVGGTIAKVVTLPDDDGEE